MELRPPLLDSSIARNNILPRHREVSEIAFALRAVDRIGALYDALRASREAVNPHETREARAMRYEREYERTMAKAEEIVSDSTDRLDAYFKAAKSSALLEAGLSKQPQNATEIRTALRGMTQSQRDKAIIEAFDRQDNEVLGAIFAQNAITWGGSKNALDSQFALYIEQAAPASREALEAGKKALEGLDLATDAFVETAKKWRESGLAEKGFKQLEEFEQAEAGLKAALNG